METFCKYFNSLEKMKLSILFLLLLTSTVLFGQDTIKTLECVEIVSVRADKETPITQTNLRLTVVMPTYTGQDMSYVLQNTPSVSVYSDNGLYNGYTYIRMRGVDQTRINMTLNGIPLNEPEDQGVYFSNYPDFAANLKSVQVQRGTGTSSNGSSSYIGSINFESQNLLDSHYVSLEAGGGSYNSYRTSIAYNSGLNGRIAVYGRYSMLGTNGYRQNSFNASRTFFTSAGWYGDKDILKLTAFSGQSSNGMAYLATNLEDINLNPRMNYLTEDEKDLFNQNLISLQWIRGFDSKFMLNSSIFYNNLQGEYGVFVGDMLNFGLKSNFGGLISSLSYNSTRTKMQLGINANIYERQHRMSIQPTPTNWLYQNSGFKGEFSAFFKVQHNFSSKIVGFMDVQERAVNFRYQQDVSLEQKLDPILWFFLNPKGGLRFIQNKNLSHYASVGQTHREPTRNDIFNGYDDIVPISGSVYQASIDGLNFDTVQIRSIKPEQVLDFEAGTDLKTKFLSVSLNAYWMQFKNEIAQTGQLSMIGLPLRQNVASSFRSGVELDLSAMPIKKLIIRQSANYSYNRIKDFGTYHNVSPLLTPNFISNTSVQYTLGNIFVGINGRYVSKSYLDNTGNRAMMTPDFAVFGANMGVNYNRMSVNFSVNNLMNKRYFAGVMLVVRKFTPV